MEKQCKKMKKNQIAEGEDRLSSLPDSLLVSILNCLPIDSAAATSVLSRRWQYLWTQRDSIHFPPIEKIDKYKNYEYFITTVDHIIAKLTTLKVNKLILDIPCVDDPKSSTFMLPWISKICRLNPKAISLRLRDIGVTYYSFQIPSCLFQTQSLSSLKLSAVHIFEFMLPDDGINLPNLKKLYLCLHDSHFPFLDTLSKSCPLLEELFILFRNCCKGHVVGNIMAPNLKCLSIGCRERDVKFEIATPKLEKIRFLGHLPFIHFVNNPIGLQKSRFDLILVQGNDDYSSKVQELFQQISCVSSLDLGESGPHMLSTLNDIVIPASHNIVHLILHSINIDGSSEAPLVLLCKLKKVELSKVVGNGLEMKFLECILSNAPVLEELHVFFSEALNDGREPEHDQSSIEYKFCNDLFLIRRKSLRCKIKFSGKRITASSDEFTNNVLNQTVN